MITTATDSFVSICGTFRCSCLQLLDETDVVRLHRLENGEGGNERADVHYLVPIQKEVYLPRKEPGGEGRGGGGGATPSIRSWEESPFSAPPRPARL